MGCGFSRNHATQTRITSFDRELLDLKVQRDNLQQYEQRLKDSLTKYYELARRLVTQKERERALVVLKVKHALQKSIEQAQNMRFNLEQVLSEIELKQLEADYVQKLKTGTKLLRDIQKNLSIDEIEHLLAETKEAMEFQNQVAQVLGDYSLVEPDEECEDELQKIETEMFPSVPKRSKETDHSTMEKTKTDTKESNGEGHMLPLPA